jgi:DNA primase
VAPDRKSLGLADRRVEFIFGAHPVCLGFSGGLPHSDSGAVTAVSDTGSNSFQPQISLLEFLIQRGWKPIRDNGREEMAGLCPLHRDTQPSFYVNRRKQVFYCHGCGRGGGLARLIHLLGEWPEPTTVWPSPGQLLDQAYRFYERQLARSTNAQAYLSGRGIHDRGVIERMRMGYAPGACLRASLGRIGYSCQTLLECGLVDERGRDTFFRCLTFPLPEAGNLYGRSLVNGICRHRFLPGSKGGFYGWEQALACRRIILVEGLFDLAALWQAGFDHAVAVLGSHLNNRQLSQLCQTDGRIIYICFDADENNSGQRASHRIGVQLRQAGAEALRVELPRGHDPSSFFAAGADGSDFRRLLERARP